MLKSNLLKNFSSSDSDDDLEKLHISKSIEFSDSSKNSSPQNSPKVVTYDAESLSDEEFFIENLNSQEIITESYEDFVDSSQVTLPPVLNYVGGSAGDDDSLSSFATVLLDEQMPQVTTLLPNGQAQYSEIIDRKEISVT